MVRDAVYETLESIIDPCSMAAGAPAGLVSMGLVGKVSVTEAEHGTDVDVTLFVTEPGCLMSVIYQINAKQKIEKLEGVAAVEVRVDYSHVWTPEDMSEEYRQALKTYRACQAEHMKKLNGVPANKGR